MVRRSTTFTHTAAIVALAALAACGEVGPGPVEELEQGATATGACKTPSFSIAPLPGQPSTLALTAASTCAGGATEYRFGVRAPGAATFEPLGDYLATGSAEWQSSAAPPGRYTFAVWVRTAGSTAGPEASAAQSRLVGASCSAVTLASRPAGGLDLEVSAAAECGGATPELRWFVLRPGATAFVEARPYGPDAGIFLSAAEAHGRYAVKVYARARGNRSDWEAQGNASALVGRACGQATLTAQYDGFDVRLAGGASCAAGATPEFRFLARLPGTAAFFEVRPWAPMATLGFFPEPGLRGRYDFQAQVRASGNASNLEAAAAASALVGPGCSRVTLAAAPRPGSQLVDLVATPTCSGVAPELRFLVRPPGAASFTEARPWAPGAAVAVPWDRAGRWEYQVSVRGAGNASELEAAATASSLVGPTCAGVTLAAREEGGAFVLDANATCSPGVTPSYRFLVKLPGAAAFTDPPPQGTATQSPWTTSPTVTIPVSTPGHYEFMVQARSPVSASEFDATARAAGDVGPTCAGATLAGTWDRGGTVQLVAGATCTFYALAEHRFSYRPPGSTVWLVVQPWSQQQIVWIPVDPAAAPGAYAFRVESRPAGMELAEQDSAYDTVLVGGACSAVSLAVTPEGPTVAVQLAATSVCDGGRAPEYRFLARRPGAAAYAELRPYAPEPLLGFAAPDEAGRYDFRVEVRARGNASAAEAAASRSALLGATCGAATLSAAYDAGAITARASASCTGGTPEYRFLVRRPGEALVEARPYAADPTLAVAVPAGATGRYELEVQTRAAGNRSDREATARASVVAGPSCPAVALATTAYGAGLEARATATCTGGGVAEYRFLFRRPGESAFTELSPWYGDGYAHLSAGYGPYGSYELLVQARAQGNTSGAESTRSASALLGPVCSAVTLAITPDGTQGKLLEASASCEGAAGEFRYLVRKPGATTFEELHPYTQATSLRWAPAPAVSGRYEFRVEARRTGNWSFVEADATASALVGAACSGATLTAAVRAAEPRTADVTAAASCPGPEVEYRFLARAPGAAGYSELRGWSWDPHAVVTAALAKSGSHAVLVQVRQKGNPSDYEVSAAASVLLGVACPAVTLQADALTPDSVRLAAAATCPGATPEYRFVVRPPGAAGFTELRGWGWDPAAIATAAPGATGRYEFRVYARATGNASDAEAIASAVRLLGPSCSGVGLSLRYPYPDVPEVAASATCTGDPEYRFLVRAAGSNAFVEARPWELGGSFYPVFSSQWGPGRHDVRVEVRAHGNASPYEATATTSVLAGATCGSATIAAVVEGLTADLTAGARCDGGGEPEFRFTIKRPGETAFTELRGWSGDPRAAFVAVSADEVGRSELQVFVRAAGNASPYEASARTAVLLGETCSTAALSAAFPPAGGGRAVELHASSACSYGGPAEYRFTLRRPGQAAFVELRGWDPEPVLTFAVPFGETGRHEFVVYVRHLGNRSEFEAAAILAARLGDTCSIAALKATPDAVSTAVDLAVAATCDAGEEYRFLARPYGTAAWSVVRAWDRVPSARFQAPAPGGYEFNVEARVEGNASPWEAAALTSAVTAGACTPRTLTAEYGGPFVMLEAESVCSGGVAPDYRYLVRKPGASEFVEAGFGGRYFSYWPDPYVFGRYEFRAEVRGAGEFSGAASADLLVGWGCGAATIAATAGFGGVADLTAGAECVSDSPLYRFFVRRPGALPVLAQDWSPFATASVPVDPEISGRWEYTVEVRGSGNASSWEARATTELRVGRSCSDVALTPVVTGGDVLLSAGATCAGGVPEYRFRARPPGSTLWTELRPYGPEPTFQLVVPTMPFRPSGTWEVEVHARAAGNASEYDAVRSETVLVGNTCGAVTLATTLDSQVPGHLRLDASATCGGGVTAEYELLVRAPGAPTFRLLRPYSPYRTEYWPIPAGPPGTYEFLVLARAAGNASPVESQAAASWVVP